MPMIHLIQPGARVAPFAVTDAALTIGDVVVTFADEQQDTSAEVVIRHSAAGFAVGSDDGAIVAVVRIPARQYVETEGGTDPMSGEPASTREALPLDTNAVTIELWPFAG